MHYNRKLLCCFLIALFALAGCTANEINPETPQDSPVQKGVVTSGTGFYFDTVVTIRLYDASENLLQEIWDRCGVYESLLSKTVEGSDVWKINHAEGKPVTVSEDTWNILTLGKNIHEASDGAFCVTLAPVTELWDFTGGTQRMPDEAERREKLKLVDDSKLVLGNQYTVTLPAGMSIDLGGIAKGYIADKIAELVTGRVSGAVLNFGGNVYVVGDKPDGSAFNVGLRDPKGNESDILGIVQVKNTSVVTSGVYERYFDKDGVRYHHILDPETGSSAITDLASATIVHPSSMLADALATACVVMGSEKAIQFLEANGYQGVLVTNDNQMIPTKDFQFTRVQ